jgi:hypothetical protein
VGDHLLRVNGKSTIGMHFDDVCKLMAGASIGATVMIEVISTLSTHIVEVRTETGHSVLFWLLLLWCYFVASLLLCFSN